MHVHESYGEFINSFTKSILEPGNSFHIWEFCVEYEWSPFYVLS